MLTKYLATLIYILINHPNKEYQNQNDYLMIERERNLKCLEQFMITNLESRIDLALNLFTEEQTELWVTKRQQLLLNLKEDMTKAILHKPLNLNLFSDLNVTNIIAKPTKQQLSKQRKINRTKKINNNYFDSNNQFRNGLEWFSKQTVALSTIEQLNALLYEYYKTDSFRLLQKESIIACIHQQNVFCIMPTGHGKTSIFILSALLSKYINKSNKATKNKKMLITVVISPLLSLIEDQCNKLANLNLTAVSLSGEIILSDVLNEIANHLYSFIFITPEKLVKSARIAAVISNLIKDNKIGRFVIDEVHCISMWGHNFRPSFLKLKEYFKRIPQIPILALTATANHKIINETIINLNIQKCLLFKLNMHRPNLEFQVIPKKSLVVCFFYYIYFTIIIIFTKANEVNHMAI